MSLDNDVKIIYIAINILIILYIIHQIYIYTSNIKEKSFTNSPSITIDLSTNPTLTPTSSKIIYWIVNNENGNYNNFEFNGIIDIIDKKVNIQIGELTFTNIEIKYRIIDNEKLSDVFSFTN